MTGSTSGCGSWREFLLRAGHGKCCRIAMVLTGSIGQPQKEKGGASAAKFKGRKRPGTQPHRLQDRTVHGVMTMP